jgi:hypothetical protein
LVLHFLMSWNNYDASMMGYFVTFGSNLSKSFIGQYNEYIVDASCRTNAGFWYCVFFLISRTVINSYIKWSMRSNCLYKQRLIFSRPSQSLQINNAAVNDHLSNTNFATSLLICTFAVSVIVDIWWNTKRYYWSMKIDCR